MTWSWTYGAAYCTPMELAIVDAVAVALFMIWVVWLSKAHAAHSPHLKR